VAAGKKMNGLNSSEIDSGTDQNLNILVDQVGEIVAKISGEQIPEKSADLASLGMDSMAKLDVLASLEERFDIVLNESVVEEFHSISHIAHIVKDVIRSKSTR
jgi:acyl carrier protein